VGTQASAQLLSVVLGSGPCTLESTSMVVVGKANVTAERRTATAGGKRAARPRSAGRTSIGRDREEQLIEVAARMFHEQGYEATSLQEMADELGLLKGSLYYYIKTKEDLLWAIIMRPHAAALALVEECSQMEAPPAERLSWFISAYAHLLAKDKIFVTVYLNELDRLSPARLRTIRRERDSFITFVIDLIEEGRRSGAFRQGGSAEIMALAILGMLNSSVRWYSARHPRSPEVVIDSILLLVSSGIVL
jgi:TetR/AcrR family transcriptional regulator, cholesterol catabolism regulator